MATHDTPEPTPHDGSGHRSVNGYCIEQGCLMHVRAPYTPEPTRHMQQSINGCVTCQRKWSQHTPAERGEVSATRDTPEAARPGATITFREPAPRHVTPDVIAHLIENGASKDLVDFARRHLDPPPHD